MITYSPKYYKTMCPFSPDTVFPGFSKVRGGGERLIIAFSNTGMTLKYIVRGSLFIPWGGIISISKNDFMHYHFFLCTGSEGELSLLPACHTWFVHHSFKLLVSLEPEEDKAFEFGIL